MNTTSMPFSLRRSRILARDVVDRLLAFLHAGRVLQERHIRPVRARGLVSQELRDPVPVLVVGGDADLQDRAELGVERVVLLLVHAFQEVEEPLHQVLSDVPHEAVLLEDLAADVEVQVGRVHHSLDEAEVFGHELLAVVHDEHAPAVEVDAVLALAHGEVERQLRGDVQERVVLGGALEPDVEVRQRLIPVMADVLVELGVLLFGDLRLGFGPDGLHGVEGLVTPDLPGRLADGLAVGVLEDLHVGQRLVAFHLHDDRVAHEVGMALHHVPDGPLVRVVSLAVPGFPEREGDRRSSALLRGFLDGIGAVSRGLPLGGGLCPCGLRDESDLVGHDEGAV